MRRQQRQRCTPGLITLVTVFSIPTCVAHWVPPTLFALLLGTILGVTVFPTAPTIGEIPKGWPEIQIPNISPDRLPAMLRFSLSQAGCLA